MKMRSGFDPHVSIITEDATLAPKSRLQDPFMSEFAETFRAAANNLSVRLDGVTSKEELAATLEDELRGLYHGLLVMFDGGTALADQG